VDFVAKCLVWDPERRFKPQAAMRHPFVTAGRRLKPPSSSTKSTPSLSSLSRNKQVTETPKKSLISAPTPLTARLSRTTTNGGPTTPNNTQSHHIASGSSHISRSYRSSQSQSLSNFNSSRTLSGYAVSDILFFHLTYLNVSSPVRLNKFISFLGLLSISLVGVACCCISF
jgi:dual specificity tyrosine-phosphorylation-regulated kinase 2/3/4